MVRGPAWPTVLLLCHLLLVSISQSTQAGVGSSSAESGGGAASIQQLRTAAKGQPNSPLAHLQLALALHELNHQTPDGGSRVPEAEQEYRKALSLISADGEHASIYVHVQGNLGALLLSADRPADAITELEAALQLGQRLQQRLKQQAKKLKRQQRATKQQQLEQVQQQQQQALLQQTQEVEKQLGGLLFNLGKAFTSVGRLADADEVYMQAATTAYGLDFASYGKALAALHNMPDDTITQASQACQAATQYFSAKDNLAFLKDVQQPSPAASTAARAAADEVADGKAHLGDWIQQADSVDLVWLYFALYKYFHHSKDYQSAWHHLQVGNRIMASLVAYDLVRDQRNYLNIKSIFQAPFVTSAVEDRTPIFVVGMPRSGSTLVEQILASHSQVFAAGEDTALAPLTPAVNKALATASPAEQPIILQHFGDKYLTAMRAKVPPDWAAKKPGRFSASSSSSSEPTRIVDKMLRNLWLVGYIHMMLPKACIVHVVRHPMDVALSCYAQPFGYSASSLAWSWDLSAIASQLQMVWDLAEHWEQQLPGKVHTVFYEELVEWPKAVAAQLLSKCGLPWEPGVLKFYDTDRPVQTASMEQVRQPLYKTSVQRWKAYRQQLEPLREALAPLIANYEQLLNQRMSAAETAATVTASKGDGSDDGSSDMTKDEL